MSGAFRNPSRLWLGRVDIRLKRAIFALSSPISNPPFSLSYPRHSRFSAPIVPAFLTVIPDFYPPDPPSFPRKRESRGARGARLRVFVRIKRMAVLSPAIPTLCLRHSRESGNPEGRAGRDCASLLESGFSGLAGFSGFRFA